MSQHSINKRIKQDGYNDDYRVPMESLCRAAQYLQAILLTNMQIYIFPSTKLGFAFGAGYKKKRPGACNSVLSYVTPILPVKQLFKSKSGPDLVRICNFATITKKV